MALPSIALLPQLPLIKDFEHITYKIDQPTHACVVTLNRPEHANAINGRLFLEIMSALAHAARDDEVWSMIWTGAGGVFCAGADFSGEDPDAYTDKDPRSCWTPLYRSGYNATVSDDSWVAALGRAFYEMDKPMVAALNGAAAGAGFAISLCCDVRVGCAKTKFVPAYAANNLPPEAGLSFLLSRVVGLGHAMDIVLSGRTVLADEARSIGLVTRLCNAREELLPCALQLAATMAQYPQPAMHVTKAAVRKGLESTFAETLKTEVGLGRKSLGNPFSQTMLVKGGSAATKVAQVRKKGEGFVHHGKSKL